MIAEHVSLLRSSDSDFIQELFAESEAEAAEATAIANSRGRRGSKSAFKLNSVGAQFRKQLQARAWSLLPVVAAEYCATIVAYAIRLVSSKSFLAFKM